MMVFGWTAGDGGPSEIDGQRILIVDDDAGSRRSLRRVLEHASLTVKCLTRGADVVDTVLAYRPDVVLLDVLLPDADGMDICRELKDEEATRLTPVVLITGLNATADRIRGLEAGADDLLTKPYERSVLLARVRSLLRFKRYTDQLDAPEGIVLALARSIEGRDPYTAGHCERLGVYSARMGERLGLHADDIQALRVGGVVHDIGKVTVPDAILSKRGPLTPEERTTIERHPVVGSEICSGLRSFHRVVPIIRHHHEKQDGTGYPDGLSGAAVPLTARILQVADVFDALTTQRPYRGPLSAADAVTQLQRETDLGWWDPAIVSVFVEMIDEDGFATVDVDGAL